VADTVKIAVCDDEKNIRVYLVSLIKKQGTECSIVEYASADEYLLDGKEHDLLFLDIEMDGSGTGLDGMGLARHIRGMDTCRQPITIFVTGYEKYVYDTFDVGAFQYLVKPVDEQKFADVFRRAVGQILSEAEQRKKKLVIQYAGEGNSIYMKITNMMMQDLDALLGNYQQQVYHCISVGMVLSVFFYTVLFVAMTVILHHRLPRPVLPGQTLGSQNIHKQHLSCF